MSKHCYYWSGVEYWRVGRGEGKHGSYRLLTGGAAGPGIANNSGRDELGRIYYQVGVGYAIPVSVYCDIETD